MPCFDANFTQDPLRQVSGTSKAESETDAIKHKYSTCETLTQQHLHKLLIYHYHIHFKIIKII